MPAEFSGKPVRVVVCGTNYGRWYLEALRLGGAGYQLAGILARGSARSRELAREHGVPFYRRAADLPRGVAIACAAMGASGAAVVLQLLERGIHVLCEHPQRAAWVKTALDTAAARGASFHVNGHFAELRPAREFIRHCRRLRQAASPAFLDVMVTDRSLYAALDILRKVLETFEPFRFELTARLAPFAVVQGALGGIPVTLQVQRSTGAEDGLLRDGSPAYLVDHRLAAGFPSGILSLLSVSGPVVWNANWNRNAEAAGPLCEVYEDTGLTGIELRRQRMRANLLAIESLVQSARERFVPPEQAPGHLLEVSRVWETVGALLAA